MVYVVIHLITSVIRRKKPKHQQSVVSSISANTIVPIPRYIPTSLLLIVTEERCSSYKLLFGLKYLPPKTRLVLNKSRIHVDITNKNLRVLHSCPW